MATTTKTPTDFDVIQQRIGKLSDSGKATVAIKKANDGTKLLTVGLVHVAAGVESSKVKGTIVPPTIHFDKDGKADSIFLPNQRGSGGVHFTMTPKMLEKIKDAMGREGGDFLGRLANNYRSNGFTTNHSTPTLSLGGSNPDEGKRTEVLQEATAVIAGGFREDGSRVMTALMGVGHDPTQKIPGRQEFAKAVKPNNIVDRGR